MCPAQPAGDTLAAEHVSSVFSLVVMSRAGVFTIPLPAAGELTLGRGEDCGFVLEDPKASRLHAVVRVGRGVEVIDLGSRNGTVHANRRLEARVPAPLAVE